MGSKVEKNVRYACGFVSCPSVQNGRWVCKKKKKKKNGRLDASLFSDFVQISRSVNQGWALSAFVLLEFVCLFFFFFFLNKLSCWSLNSRSPATDNCCYSRWSGTIVTCN